MQRSSDFASRNEGGVYQQFVAAAKWLQSAPPNVEIAVSHQTSNHGHALITDGPMRAMSFLTHRPIMLAPDDLSTEPTAAAGDVGGATQCEILSLAAADRADLPHPRHAVGAAK